MAGTWLDKEEFINQTKDTNLTKILEFFRRLKGHLRRESVKPTCVGGYTEGCQEYDFLKALLKFYNEVLLFLFDGL